jgi:excisionase family DNA binding protein
MTTNILRTSFSSTEASQGIGGFATVTDAADFLQLSKAMVHMLIGESKIPARRYGRSVRISWAWLLKQANGGSE